MKNYQILDVTDLCPSVQSLKCVEFFLLYCENKLLMALRDEATTNEIVLYLGIE